MTGCHDLLSYTWSSYMSIASLSSCYPCGNELAVAVTQLVSALAAHLTYHLTFLKTSKIPHYSTIVAALSASGTEAGFSLP